MQGPVKKHRPLFLLAALSGLLVPASATALLLWACDAPRPVEEVTAKVADEKAPVVEEASAVSPGEAGAAKAAEVSLEAAAVEVAEKVEAAPAPIGVRVSTRTTMVYSAPRYGSDMRGRIDAGSPFAIYGMAGDRLRGRGLGAGGRARGRRLRLSQGGDGERRGAAGAAGAAGGAVSCRTSTPSRGHDRKGKLLAEVPRYRNKHALMYGREPVDYLEPHRKYAFVDLRKMGGTARCSRTRRADRAGEGHEARGAERVRGADPWRARR
jgi:hypothetical protein